MSTSHDPQQGPVYGQEGAYAAPPTPPSGAADGPTSAQPGASSPPSADAPQPGYPQAGDQQLRDQQRPDQRPGYPPSGYPSSGYPPSGYPQPGYPQGAARPAMPRNDLAVWSLVLGLLGVLGCVFFTGIPAVIVGNNARRAVAAGEADNEGMATAGVVLGWVASGLGALMLVAFALLALLPLVFLGFAVPFMESVP